MDVLRHQSNMPTWYALLVKLLPGEPKVGDCLLVHFRVAPLANQPHGLILEPSVHSLAVAVAATKLHLDHVKGPLVTMGSPDCGFKGRGSQLHAKTRCLTDILELGAQICKLPVLLG